MGAVVKFALAEKEYNDVGEQLEEQVGKSSDWTVKVLV